MSCSNLNLFCSNFPLIFLLQMEPKLREVFLKEVKTIARKISLFLTYQLICICNRIHCRLKFFIQDYHWNIGYKLPQYLSSMYRYLLLDRSLQKELCYIFYPVFKRKKSKVSHVLYPVIKRNKKQGMPRVQFSN